MGQFGFFDADRRLAAITAKGDPLEMIARVVPFESFRAEIEAAVLTPVSEKKSTAGRKPIDVMVMFRMLVLQSLYNLSDEQVEYQVREHEIARTPMPTGNAGERVNSTVATTKSQIGSSLSTTQAAAILLSCD
jgi:hypothetical protein